MTLISELDLGSVKLNQYTKCISQRSNIGIAKWQQRDRHPQQLR